MSKFTSNKVYFVDEAGDTTIFNKKGRVIIGNEGVSRFFILGLLEIGDLNSLNVQLNSLRANLLSDPYFKGVPSMQPGNKKTALSFHAKDDLPEVRREVFNLLRNRDDFRFFAAVADKYSTLDYIRSRETQDWNYRYKQDEAYDFLVRRLFKERLHKAEEFRIMFAKRGSKERTKTLKQQLEIARRRFRNASEDAPLIDVESGLSRNYPGLQAVDYFLWALQRLFEIAEDRFLIPLWKHYKLVIDLNDYTNHKYGEYYNKKNPLTREKLESRL